MAGSGGTSARRPRRASHRPPTDPGALPDLYLSCGTEDALYADNAAFGDACGRAGVDVTTSFGPGAHTWDFWDARIADVLAWLPLDPAG